MSWVLFSFFSKWSGNQLGLFEICELVAEKLSYVLELRSVPR